MPGNAVSVSGFAVGEVLGDNVTLITGMTAQHNGVVCNIRFMCCGREESVFYHTLRKRVAKSALNKRVHKELCRHCANKCARPKGEAEIAVGQVLIEEVEPVKPPVQEASNTPGGAWPRPSSLINLPIWGEQFGFGERLR